MAVTEDRRRVGLRLLALQYLATAIFIVLAVGFWILQIVQHARYLEMAENNHQRTLALQAPRGVVFDRNGDPLVQNRDSYSISIVREHTSDLDRTIRVLAQAIGMEEATVREIVQRHVREPLYRPIRVVSDATLAQVTAVAARRYELPDVTVEDVPTRQYPPATLAAHVFGYVGEASEAQVSRNPALKSGDIVGQSGVERFYNSLLMGEEGARRVVVNSVGREIDTLEEIEAVEGSRLRLTIDADVQRAVEEAFAAFGYTGASVLMDPQTGEILSLASVPGYDPNAFAGGIDRAAWNTISTDTRLPLQDRAIQGRYSPGSTFKMAVAVAALEEGVIDPDFTVNCRGAATFFGRQFRCWKADGHGPIDLRHALEHSCNVYFYTVGNMVGIDRIHKWATLLGLGVPTGIDLPGEVTGIMPSPAWKLQQTGDRWYPGETISVAIGQGPVSVTPVSMAVMISTLANGGTRVTPHLLQAVDEGQGWINVPPPAPQSAVSLKPETLKAIADGLWMVVNGDGTGQRAKIPGYDVSGKTGTAQVISAEGRAAAGRTTRDLRSHGWFVFFAPRDNPRIAGAILTEHSEHGSNAAPIAKYAMETYFAKLEGRPLPPPLAAPQPPLPVPVEERLVVIEASGPAPLPQ